MSTRIENGREDPLPLWPRLMRFITERWRGHTETEALREAVEEILDAPTEGDREAEEERALLANVVALRDKDVIDCMVPRADIVSIDVAASFEDLVTRFAESAHSRLPAWRDKLDDVVGMVHMKDVMERLVNNTPCAVAELVRPVLFVAPSTPAPRLLLQMRQTRKHMAMVVDEFGGIDGLITIEDLVEQIVGAIEDEHDIPEPPQIVTRADGTLLVDARLPIDVFESRLGHDVLDTERETIDTVGGWVAHLVGHVPQAGETVHGPYNLVFDILETNTSRIARMRVHGMPILSNENKNLHTTSRENDDQNQSEII